MLIYLKERKKNNHYTHLITIKEISNFGQGREGQVRKLGIF